MGVIGLIGLIGRVGLHEAALIREAASAAVLGRVEAIEGDAREIRVLRIGRQGILVAIVKKRRGDDEIPDIAAANVRVLHLRVILRTRPPHASRNGGCVVGCKADTPGCRT